MRARRAQWAISGRINSGRAWEGRLRAYSHELISRALRSPLSPAVPAASLSAGAVSAAAAAALLLAAASAAPAAAAPAALLALPDAQAARALQTHLDNTRNRISSRAWKNKSRQTAG